MIDLLYLSIAPILSNPSLNNKVRADADAGLCPAREDGTMQCKERGTRSQLEKSEVAQSKAGLREEHEKKAVFNRARRVPRPCEM
jgi:hypothetical protein